MTLAEQKRREQEEEDRRYAALDEQRQAERKAQQERDRIVSRLARQPSPLSSYPSSHSAVASIVVEFWSHETDLMLIREHPLCWLFVPACAHVR